MSTQAATPMSTEVSMNRPRRYVSIDLLRGLTIAFMILVNDNASDAAYWPLQHADWNGLTPTDLVFPTFLFLVGVSIVLSTAKRLQQGANRVSLLGHVVRRAVIIFLLGLVVTAPRSFISPASAITECCHESLSAISLSRPFIFSPRAGEARLSHWSECCSLTGY